MNRIPLDTRLPIVATGEQYLRLLNVRLNDLLKQIIASINSGGDGYLFASKVITGAYTMQQADQVIILKNTGNCQITLPNPEDCVGKRLTVKVANNSGHTVTIAGPSGNIDGAASIVTTTHYDKRDIVSDGTDFWTV